MKKLAIFLFVLIGFLQADNFLNVKKTEKQMMHQSNKPFPNIKTSGNNMVDFSTNKATNKDFIDGKINHFKEEIDDVKQKIDKQNSKKEELNSFSEEKPQEMEEAKPTNKSEMSKNVSKMEVYDWVQVGAFGEEKNAKKFLNFVKNFFNNSKIEFINGYFKILVGPFTSREEAKEALQEVKEDFKDAFLISH